MYEGIKKRTKGATVLAATGLYMSTLAFAGAQAGGLGGDCCADLEERVAELEATTVRKGNRKVSLKLSGQVNRMIMWWDDGFEDNVYSVDNDTSSSRFRLTGKAKILPNLEAGYKIEIQVESPESDDVDQIDDDGGKDGDGELSGRKISWYLKHKAVGKLTIGRDSPATRDLIHINLGGNNVIATAELQKWAGNFQVRYGNGNLDGNGQHIEGFYGDLASGFKHNEVRLQTNRMDLVRYDTPTIAGFTISAAWGEDDFWDVALRYAGEFGDFRLAGGVGYLVIDDEEADGGNFDTDLTEVKGSASVIHTPTGLFATGAFVHREYDGTAFNRAVTAGRFSDVDMYYGKGGIYTKFLPLGKTSIYGEYAKVEGGMEGQNALFNSAGTAFTEISSSEVEMFGFGVVQKIHPAAMELYAAYRQYEFDASGITGAAGTAVSSANIEGLSVVAAGARIKF